MSGYTAPFFFQRFTDQRGQPLSGGSIKFTVAGSNVLKAIYLDYTALVQAQNPMPLDAGGLPNAEYYFATGLYDVTVYDAAGNIIQKWLSVTAETSGGAGSDTYTVKTIAGDTTAQFLADKLLDSNTVTWAQVNNSGIIGLQATANSANILDHKIKAKSSDAVPGYLDSKIASTATIGLSIDSYNQLNADLLVTDLMHTTGGTFTGPVTFADDLIADAITANSVSATTVSGNTVNALSLNAINTYTQDLQVTSLASTGDSMAVIDSDGVIGAVAGSPFMVKYDDADLAAGYLDTKIQAGNGILINTTSDITNGTVMHINTIASDTVASVRGKASNIKVTTAIPTSLFAGIAYPQYNLGSFTVPAGTTIQGNVYRIELVTTYALDYYYLDVALSTVGGSLNLSAIQIPAGYSKLTLDVIFPDIIYGTFPIVTYTLNSAASPYFSALEPVACGEIALGGFDPNIADMAVDLQIYTGAVATTVSATANLWRL